MSRQKTLLSAEAQWQSTAAYYQREYARYGPTEVSAQSRHLLVFHGTHALASDGDVLFVTQGNGMGSATA